MNNVVVLEGIRLWLVTIGLGIIVVALGGLLRYLFKSLDIKLESWKHGSMLIENEVFASMYDGFRGELETVVENQVDALNQLYVKDWKAAREDGKLTEEEIKVLKETLVSNTCGNLSRAANRFLRENVPSFEGLIFEISESYINLNKEIEEASGGN